MFILKNLNVVELIRFVAIVKSNFHWLLLFLRAKDKRKFLAFKTLSHSQLHQDLFVLDILNFKHDGFFVEFGACDGKYLSNTLMMEENFNWKGILSEPCRQWHKELKASRSAIVDTRCVWSKTGESIEFLELVDDAALSGHSGSLQSLDDLRSEQSKRADMIRKYPVETVSLNDLLDQNTNRSFIDFLSVDTEGSEFEILKKLDFKKYSFGVVCVEHNYKSHRESIHALLRKNGYVRKNQSLSRFDDWYVNQKILNNQ